MDPIDHAIDHVLNAIAEAGFRNVAAFVTAFLRSGEPGRNAVIDSVSTILDNVYTTELRAVYDDPRCRLQADNVSPNAIERFTFPWLAKTQSAGLVS